MSNIIVIRHLGGCGGCFIGSLLRIACDNKDPIKNGIDKICEYGSCHFVDRELFLIKDDNSDTDVEYLNLFLDNLNKDSSTTYIYVTHVKEIIRISNNVDKIINLYGEIDDAKDIGKVFSIKNTLDFNIDMNESISYITNNIKNYTRIEKENLLNISWKEMLYKDLNILIPELEAFTGIGNISYDFFKEWRKRTISIL